jgi:hypothetical protein
MIYVLLGMVVVLIAIFIRKTHQPKVNGEAYKDRLSDYNQSCRLIKLDYREGKLSAEQAKAKLEEIGDKYQIPQFRRTKSLGAVQRRHG